MMKDREIEELVRKSWQPEPPDGMRERVLNRARRELHQRRFPWLALPRWQVGFAAAALVIVIASGISNSARESRLAALENNNGAAPRIVLAQTPLTLGESRARIYRLLLEPSTEPIVR